eukprot:TRINITY_DN2764_c0_g3_i1.p1 TRINITY_DN2764_c0_g3~~TRINITY_DN2764_c0_g3_i1.p1  ORF type:complete len:319 (-),score=78.46 TRINITY_DN2764_c0_g3_i1:1018-1974(-)
MNSIAVFALFSIVIIVGTNGQTTEQLIRSKGFPFELHTATTVDGYDLALHRIPGKQGSVPVVLQHGFLDTSATFVLNDRSNSLGFMLADAGFDVWISNTRMNTYSYASNVIKSLGKWGWTFDQHAYLDYPTALEYVQKQTGKKPHVVAHSQGGTTLLQALAYVKLPISKITLLAPVVSLKHLKSPLLIALYKLNVDVILDHLPEGPFAPTNPFLHSILGELCKRTPSLCDFTLSAGLFGPTTNLNQSRMGIYVNHWPDRTSIRNMVQWIQDARAGTMKTYNGIAIDFASVKNEMQVFLGDRDYLSTMEDTWGGGGHDC